jgi:hypothetical protein
MVKPLTLPKLIRRLLVGLALATLLVGAMATGVAAANGSSRQPLPPPPSPATHPCPSGAEIVVTIKRWNEYVTTTPAANGTTVYFYSGVILATVTNPATGRSMLLNNSGSGTKTVYSDGSGTFIGHGPNGAPYAPQFGLFPWDTVDGVLQYTFDSANNVTSLSYTGHVTDICAALS